MTIRKVVEMTFADEGVEVSAVPDAESAMQKFLEIQPDIVLVDVGLEGTSGYQICEMIKLDEATRHIPVLLLVGSFEPFDQDEAERVGADGFLTKPFHSIRDLVARVTELLGRGSPPQTTQEETGLPAEVAAVKPASQDLTTETFQVPALPEADDIESLYQRSFAETVEIDEYDTVDDMLGDPALDDEMIEASYPAAAAAETNNGSVPPEPSGEQTKDFDWSDAPIAAIGSHQPEPAPFEPKFSFDESQEDDTLMESEVAKSEEALLGPQLPAVVEERTETSALPDPVVPEADESIEAVAPEVPGSAAAEPQEELEASTMPSLPDLSPEMIDAIAQRVVEKLSDQVIREVALETVPKVAEKLIREALTDNRGA